MKWLTLQYHGINLLYGGGLNLVLTASPQSSLVLFSLSGNLKGLAGYLEAQPNFLRATFNN